MSNFISTFKQGQEGENFGLSTGIPPLDKAINGIQKKTSIGLVASPKVGKTTLADFAFVIHPYLECESKGILDDVEWIYYSFEIDRINKEFKFAAFFMSYDFNINYIYYKNKVYKMSQDYLMGRLLHQIEGTEDFEFVPIEEQHELNLKHIYYTRIIPLFGEFDSEGKQIKPGKIQYIEEAENPTGMNKFLFAHAKANGKFIEVPYEVINENKQRETRYRITGYIPNNPKKFTFVLTDHVRKLKRERGFTMKENIDKWLEYTTFLRNICSWVFINICHGNRSLANIERIKLAGEYLFPTADDVKDTGNIAEESTILMTLFNPNDEKYNISKHFGIALKDYPNYRSIHITESRYTDCPAHIQVNMYGGVNRFTPLNQKLE